MRFYLISCILFISAPGFPFVSAEDCFNFLPTESDYTVSALPKDSLITPIQDSLNNLRKKLEQFEYSSVISGANRLLFKKEQIPKKQLIETYQLKAISHFALAEDENAERSFIEILKIDSSFTLDSTRISPKIISFFKKVKDNYLSRPSLYDEENRARIDTVYISHLYESKISEKVRQSVVRSFLFPGLGHLYLKPSAEGWILTTLTAISATSLIYFWIDADKKEKLYLNESNPQLIAYRYRNFNRSYRSRNISLFVLAGIWTYTQIDLLFFSDLFQVDVGSAGISSTGIYFKYYF